MSKPWVGSSLEFEPPKYIAALIQAVNDGARTAQTGALALGGVGLYLLANSFSTTDQDLVLGHTLDIAQFGVQVAPEVAFGIAPWVFVALHVFTLVRYAMLTTNLRSLRTELAENFELESDRERCRQLLANVEFIMANAAPRTSALHSGLFRAVTFVIIAFFPVFVLVSDQLSALRYQSDAVTDFQRLALAIDLMMLIWYYGRAGELAGVAWGKGRRLDRVAMRRSAQLVILPMTIMGLDLLWLNVPGDDLALAPGMLIVTNQASAVWTRSFWAQPLDHSLCPATGWGCRTLHLRNTILVAKAWPDLLVSVQKESAGAGEGSIEALEGGFLSQVQMIQGDSDEGAIIAIEGAPLSLRNLRFADLERAKLYAAHLEGSDLTGANLQSANLYKADMFGATVKRTNMDSVDLAGGDLGMVDFSGVGLTRADFAGAYLQGAKFSGAFLLFTNFTGADLRSAHFTGAQIDAGTMFTDARCNKSTDLPPEYFCSSGLVRSAPCVAGKGTMTWDFSCGPDGLYRPNPEKDVQALESFEEEH